MKRSTTFRSWAFAALALLALGACNREWDGNRAAAVGAGPAGMATAQDAMGMAAAAGVRGAQPGTAAAARPAFASLPDRGDLVGYPRDRVVRREGAYTWHRTDVSEEHALRAIVDGELRITAPDGSRLAFEYERHVEHPTGDWTWVGRLRDAPPGRQAILTFGARAVFGSIAQAVSEPLRLTMRDGASWLVETDPALAAAVEAQVLRPESPDFLVPPLYLGNPAAPKASGDSAATSASQGSVGSVQGSSSTASSTTTVVDVLVGYTPGFATYHGGDSQARTRINFLVDVANQGYINSQIDARVRLVHAMPVNYPDATDNGETLEKMTGYKSGTGKTTPDPAFSELRNARETYGADLVTLIRKFNTPENDGCGIAWLIGGGLTAISQGHEYFGYSVVGDGIDQGTDGKNYFCREETMVHEFGHNMGSAHDIETAKGDDGILQTKEYGRYTYSFGYRTGPGAGDFYTIMAYREKRETGTQQQPYRVFSNPQITFCGSFPCGTSSADNARSLRQVMPLISDFRATVAPLPQPRRNVPNDMDGDGKTDLFWRHPDSGSFAAWLMNGNIIRQVINVDAKAPPSYSLVGTGDLDGDGLTDLLWTSAAGDLWLWTSRATGFVTKLVSYYPLEWMPIGVADVNGDGNADILWRHELTGSFAYWLMNGSVVNRVVNVSPKAPANYSLVDARDFNGDGKADLLWTSPARDLWLWTASGESFVTTLIDYYPSGWEPIGAGDLNGDGYSDIFWRHPSSGSFAYWLMSGADVIGIVNVAPKAPADYWVVSIGDFNADGRADLAWTSPALDLWVWISSGSSFVTTLVSTYPSSWAPAK